MIIFLGIAVNLSLIGLALAQGPTVKMPGLLGMDRETAQKELDRSGLRMYMHTEGEKVFPGIKAVYKVVRQNPPPGKLMARNALVDVFFKVEIIKARVPCVEGLPLDIARRRLAEAGFQVRIQILEKYIPTKDGLVYIQDPLPDRLSAVGGLVRLTVYPSKASQVTQGFPTQEQVPGFGIQEGMTRQPDLVGTDRSAVPKRTPQNK